MKDAKVETCEEPLKETMRNKAAEVSKEPGPWLGAAALTIHAYELV